MERYLRGVRSERDPYGREAPTVNYLQDPRGAVWVGRQRVGVAIPQAPGSLGGGFPDRSSMGRAGRSAADCPTCHGRRAPPLPGNPWDMLDAVLRRDRGGQGSAGPGKRRSDQCDKQYDRDSGVCRGQPNKQAKERCWSSASRRLAWCTSHQGEVGYPRLETDPYGPPD